MTARRRTGIHIAHVATGRYICDCGTGNQRCGRPVAVLVEYAGVWLAICDRCAHELAQANQGDNEANKERTA